MKFSSLVKILVLVPGLALAETDYKQFFKPSTGGVGKTVAQQMNVADVSQEFDCPLFSNSPYADILKSINSLESAIKLFPSCAADGNLKSTVEVGKDLKSKITGIKQAMDSGKGVFNTQVLDEVLTNSAEFQELLVNLAQTSEPCYKEEKNKGMIFKINDALQSISPMALEFVTKVPGLNSAVLPAVAGSAALVQGISTLEKVMSESATLDVSNSKQGSENRIALIKNTCQFMKVYNKVEYLQLGRAERSRRIEQEFKAQVKPLQEKSESLMDVLRQTQDQQSPEAKAVAKIKVANRGLKAAVESARDEFNGSNSDVGKCTAAKTLAKIVRDNSFLANYEKLAKYTGKQEVSSFKVNKFAEINSRMQVNSKDAKLCAAESLDWISVVGELLHESNKLITRFEKDNSSSQTFIAAVDDLKATTSKTQDVQENRKKLEKFTEISVFEPSEISKKMNGLPRYLFNGPDGGWTGFLKNGPVYDFLMNNDDTISRRMNTFSKNMETLYAFEQKQIRERVPRFQRFNRNKDVIEFYAQLEAAKKELPRINPEYVEAGSETYKNICGNIKMAIKSFQEVKDLVASSYYMCEMIDPVLMEESIASKLRKYCRSSDEGYRAIISDLYAQGAPSMFEKLLDRKKGLDCE